MGPRSSVADGRAYDPAEALQQAREAFWKGGYLGTSLDDISAATGMDRPSLSAAFGDKRALYLAALRDYWVAKFAAMHEALNGGTLQGALLRAYDASLSLYFDGDQAGRGCFVVGTAITEAMDDPEICEITHAGFQTLDAHFKEQFRLARDAGEIDRDADVDALGMLATATIHSLAVRARAGTLCVELRSLSRKAVAVMCRLFGSRTTSDRSAFGNVRTAAERNKGRRCSPLLRSADIVCELRHVVQLRQRLA